MRQYLINSNSLESIIDSDEYLIPDEIYDQLMLEAHCLEDGLGYEGHGSCSLTTVDTLNYLQDIINIINMVFKDKPYNTRDVFIDLDSLNTISKNILYIIMYSNLDTKELSMYLANIFKEDFVNRLVVSLMPMIDRFKNDTAEVVGFDFYTIKIFNIKDNTVDLAVISI